MRYFARVEYDGSKFNGWQVQPDSLTVQGELNRALSLVCREEVSCMGAGRTDAGVHGVGQAIHFDLSNEIDTFRIHKSVNSVLPPTIAIYNLQAVSSDFHARYSAQEREYQYFISTRKRPLQRGHAMYVSFQLDWDAIKKAVSELIGTHCFTSFCASGYYSDNHTCTVTKAEIVEVEEGLWCFTVAANRFVYKMIRTLVGTLIDIGRGKTKLSMRDIIAAEDRAVAGATAQPQGLIFYRVAYDEVD